MRGIQNLIGVLELEQVNLIFKIWREGNLLCCSHDVHDLMSKLMSVYRLVQNNAVYKRHINFFIIMVSAWLLNPRL
jgi:hypothetical protein